MALYRALVADVAVPVTLHLDHCPERAVITECLDRGWNSVLFDASHLPVEENKRQTVEVVAEARRHGADVEGEIESITGVEDGIGSDTEARRQDLKVALDFLETTNVDVFAPAIGNAHGTYRSTPVLDFQRVSDIVAAHPVPIALHGGSGLTDEQFRDLIARGCAKVNISTALKEKFMKSSLAFLTETAAKDKWDPPSLFRAVRADVVDMAGSLMTLFGSAGRAG
jgi:fructose-bisphosphate aldolase class II